MHQSRSFLQLKLGVPDTKQCQKEQHSPLCHTHQGPKAMDAGVSPLIRRR